MPPLAPRHGTIALVGCVKQKLDHAAPASELYTSTLFKREREWAIARCSQWFILSAKHGLIAPDTVIEPYELTLRSVPSSARRSWSHRVLQQLKTSLGPLDGRHFEVYAGKEYCEEGLVQGLRQAGATVVIPWAGLGLGQRLARTDYAS
jgi:uncharacterized protein DUF6884